ncbi:hypothetical protein BLA29_007170 [Euroglyphus maynei]|uniref:Uncharacterized protein n=1 Tax=Euroglyphus maynei TaxID=6958 RepID=A0A1Y3AV87_EURMA|nr:hypothetical protein BLA29_007170 [Euroglyphus maynei]
MCSFYTAKQENDQNPSSSILLVYELLPNQTSHVLGPFVSASVGTIHSSIICEAEIQQGRRYLLAVFSFDGNSTFGSNVLRIHSSRRLRFKMFEPNSALRGDLIIHYVLACGRPYEVCIFSYEINRNAQHWIQVSMKARWKYSSTALIDQYERFTNDDHHVLEGRPATSMTKSANHCLSSDKISSLQQSNSMMITSRGSLQTVDLIAPGYCQLINMIVDSSQQFSHNHRHISIAMNFKYRSIGDKINDYMSISHEPDIGLTYGLHSARPIIINKNK